MSGSHGGLQGAVVGRGATLWAELASERQKQHRRCLTERQGESSMVCCKNIRFRSTLNLDLGLGARRKESVLLIVNE